MAREFWIKENKIFPLVAYDNEHGPGLIHVREVDPSAPDFKKLCEDLAGALEKVCAPESDEFGDFVADEFMSLEILEGREILSAYRSAMRK